MNALWLGALTSMGLGALTVIHPCPLSSNIAAVSFLSGWRGSSRTKLITTALFIFGETAAFVGLGALLSIGVLSLAPVANFLQVHVRQLFGPILILAGMMLLGILLPQQSVIRFSEKFLRALSRLGKWGGLFLGALVALSFCPMSAAIYFGVLIPLAISHNAAVLYPLFYGIGAGFPIVLIAAVVTQSAVLINRNFLIKKSLEKSLREIASVAMILIGIYMTLRHIFFLF